MGRLRTIGFEIGIGSPSVAATTIEGDGSWGGVLSTIDATVSRSGASSLKSNSGGTNQTVKTDINIPSSNQVFARFYVRMDAFPNVPVPIAQLCDSARAPLGVIFVTGTGHFYLHNSLLGVQIGSESTFAATLNDFCMIEIYGLRGTAGVGQLELRVEGVSVASGTTDLGSSDFAIVRVGWGQTPGANKSIWFDDIAINDNTGASQNTWPGEGKIVLLKPISDNQRGSWTGGAGGTTNLWEAINNTPPIGTATETDLTQIESADSSGDNATDEYRANMTDYATAGILAADVITLCQAVIDHGEDVITGTKTGSFLILSNPAQSVADTFNFGDDVDALGTWPNLWRATWGAAQVGPTVVLGTSPVLRIRKTDATTRVGSVDFAGIYVEYIPTTAAPAMAPFGEMMFPVGS